MQPAPIIAQVKYLTDFNNFLPIDATDRSKSSSDQKRFFIALSLYPLSFFANTPFKCYNLNLYWSCFQVQFSDIYPSKGVWLHGSKESNH